MAVAEASFPELFAKDTLPEFNWDDMDWDDMDEDGDDV